MDSFYDPLDICFFTSRRTRKLTKYAILLNEANPDNAEEEKKEPCPLAAELLPDLLDEKENEDLVTILGDILKTKILGHAEVDKVAILKPDEIIETNDRMLVPVMYRIAAENFAQADKSTFKIIECRNITKLISDWKPSLPDKLIALGHQVIVVQLETSFVPYTDFAYAILRQIDCDWKKRLPRSFFFPDDVCKVIATSGRDLCVVSPSMPDGDLEINKKMGLLNYELLMMIKASCMSAMKNYLMKRDLRVGKFSDTLDGVSALRQLYRKLQEKLRTGESIELQSSSMEDLQNLVKQSVGPGGADVLAAQTWIEYGKRIGLAIPASASSSATSISSARSIIQRSNSNLDVDEYDTDENSSVNDDEEDVEDSRMSEGITLKALSSSVSGFDVDDRNDCQRDVRPPDNKSEGNQSNGESKTNSKDDPVPLIRSISSVFSKEHHHQEEQQDSGNSLENQILNKDDGDFRLETFTEFKESLKNLERERERRKIIDDDDDDEDDDLSFLEFTAESIIEILQVPKIPFALETFGTDM